MSETITINPVTRLEGHGKITIELNDQGEVENAHFHVTQVRGFEKFAEGRPFYEMPSLMARICGICPISHLLASAKACEAIMSVRIPNTAAQLRRVLNLAQMVQSHALSFFYLSSPDLLLGMESDPAARNIFGVVAAKPELGRAGVALRRFGQHIIELLANKRIHPGWVVPGGLTEPRDVVKRDEILAMLPEAHANLSLALDAYKQIAANFKASASVGLTVAKLNEVRRILEHSHALDDESEAVTLIIGSNQHADLRNQAQVTSSDFNKNGGVLENGIVRRFMGFDIVVSERLPLVSSNVRGNLAFAKTGIYLGMWQDLKTEILRRPDLEANPWDISTVHSFGATRTELGKVVQILVADTTGADNI